MCERRPDDVKNNVQKLFDATLPFIKFPPSAPGELRPARRLKLWELEGKLHCPVVGTCLALEELRKISRQSGFRDNKVEPYELHAEAVSLCSTRNPVSEGMHKQMERKHVLFVKAFEKAENAQTVLTTWRHHIEQGEIDGALWAALTHKAADPHTRSAIYADMHMLTHQLGAERAADVRRLKHMQAENADKTKQLRDLALRHSQGMADKSAKIHQLARECEEGRQIRQISERLRERLDKLESGTNAQEWQKRLNETQSELQRAKTRIHHLEKRQQDLLDEIAALRQRHAQSMPEREAMEQLCLENIGQAKETCADCTEIRPDRCILCVGGRAPLLPQYRQLAARLGLRFIHHDGGREESMARLPELLNSADAVICPTDCVSHSAYYQLKRHCKQQNKPCMMARSSGIASVAVAMQQLTDDWRKEAVNEID